MLQSRNKQNFYLIQAACYFWQDVYTFLQKKKLEGRIFAFEWNILQINLDFLIERSSSKRVNTEHPSLVDGGGWRMDHSTWFSVSQPIFKNQSLMLICFQDHGIHDIHWSSSLPAFLHIVLVPYIISVQCVTLFFFDFLSLPEEEWSCVVLSFTLQQPEDICL